MQRAVLRKVARPEDERRLAFIPRSTRERHRFFMLPGSLGCESKVASRDVALRGAVHQFAMQGERLRLLPAPSENSSQTDEGERVSP